MRAISRVLYRIIKQIRPHFACLNLDPSHIEWADSVNVKSIFASTS